MATPTRYPSGISTQAVGRNLANYPMPDPTKAFTHFDDFIRYAAAEWTVGTGVNAGTAAATAAKGGAILLTTAAVSTADYESLAANPATFNFASTDQVWFYTRLQASEVTASIILAGLTAGALGATLAPTDGIYFKKNAAAATIDLVLTKASTSTTLASVATLTAATNIKLGFYYNGKDAVDVFVNEVKVASQSTLTNLPTATALTTGFGIVNGAAAAKTLQVDFTLGAQDRGA